MCQLPRPLRGAIWQGHLKPGEYLAHKQVCFIPRLILKTMDTFLPQTCQGQPRPVWLSWWECRPKGRKAAGSIPSQGTCPGWGCVRGNKLMFLSHIDVSLSLTLSLKSISKFSGEDNKYCQGWALWLYSRDPTVRTPQMSTHSTWIQKSQ